MNHISLLHLSDSVKLPTLSLDTVGHSDTNNFIGVFTLKAIITSGKKSYFNRNQILDAKCTVSFSLAKLLLIIALLYSVYTKERFLIMTVNKGITSAK